MNTDLRSEPREHIRLPVHDVAGHVGHTCDVSASGMYFEFPQSFAVGRELDLTVALVVEGRAVQLRCRGRVLRSRKQDGWNGIAIRMLSSRLEAAGQIW